MYRIMMYLTNSHHICIEASSIDYYYNDEEDKVKIEITDGNTGVVYEAVSNHDSRDWEKIVSSMSEATRCGFADMTVHGMFRQKVS